MGRIILLHTNDIHGRIEGLTRIAALVSQLRAENEGTPVLYLDAGDSEEYANRLSSLTKGVAMHRLLAGAGCDAAAVGNAILSRYGPKAVTEETAATHYPHLAANILYADGGKIPGIEPAAILQIGELRLGVIGVTAETNENNNYERFFGMKVLPAIAAIREQAARLREAGADAVILLSHMGLKADREAAAALQGVLPLIIGGHSHDLLPEGEWAGNVLIAQAGQYAEHLGRVDLEWDGRRLLPVAASALPVTETVGPSERVQALVERIEHEVQEHLGEIICHLPAALDYAIDRECGMGNLLADALRLRSQADVAVAVPGPQFIGGLPSGPLIREALWSVCPSTGNPGVVRMTGAQLAALVQRGLDPTLAEERHPAMRGQARGLMHVSGAQVQNGQLVIRGESLVPERIYQVAASDFELEPFWGYTDQAWQLDTKYEVDVILREVLDDYLRAGGVLPVEMGRLG